MAQITNDWAADRPRLRLIPGGQAAAPTGRNRNGGLNCSSLSRLEKLSMRKTRQPRQSSICSRTDHEQTYKKESGKKATD